MLLDNIKMLYCDRIDVCHYWNVLDIAVQFQPDVYNIFMLYK